MIISRNREYIDTFHNVYSVKMVFQVSNLDFVGSVLQCRKWKVWCFKKTVGLYFCCRFVINIPFRRSNNNYITLVCEELARSAYWGTNKYWLILNCQGTEGTGSPIYGLLVWY